VWNGPVHDERDFKDSRKSSPKGVTAEFVSTVPGYSLYWQETFFGA
jgi:hypothetical protein